MFVKYFPIAPHYGVGPDFRVYQRDDIDGVWRGPLKNSCCVISITNLHDGTLLGIGHDNQLYTKSTENPNEPWGGPVVDSCCMVDVTVLADGTIIGVHTNGYLYTRESIEGSWSTPTASSCCVKSISPLTNGGIVGVNGNGVYVRPNVEGTWTKVDDGGSVDDISVNVDGRVIGAGREVCGIFPRPYYDHIWMDSVDDQCFHSLSFIRSREYQHCF